MTIRLCFIVALSVMLACAMVAWSYAQEPAAAPEPPSWTVKLNAALTKNAPMVLTAEEARALAESYAAALNAQAADIAISDTTCYVLTRDGKLLGSKALPRKRP